MSVVVLGCPLSTLVTVNTTPAILDGGFHLNFVSNPFFVSGTISLFNKNL
jgi:hypothetical protein